jgi:hypothetical protein
MKSAGEGIGMERDTSAIGAARRLALPLLFLAAFPAALRAAPAAAAATPVLKVTQAVYRADQNVLEFAFTVDNPADSVVYVDCQGQPQASLGGKELTLRFAARDSAEADTARPQRVGARQTYRGHRRIFGLGPDATGGPAHPADPAAAARLRVEMAAYPERLEGEGEAWLRDRALRLSAPASPLARKGKRPPPPKPVRVVKPPED